uniref:L antigen family member 3 n=1 Tax=Rhinolophus ferrumequinum TaxID=59479 RepID=A0A671DT67_RHIFE
MQAPDQGPDDAAGGDEGHGTPGDAGGPDGPAGHEGPGRGDEGEAGAAACEAPQAAQALQAPIPGGNTVQGPGDQAASERSGDSFAVPFPSSVAAEVARRSLASRVQFQDGAVRKELIVSGNMLKIRLTAEDPAQLQISVNSCLEQLSLLVRTVQSFVPPFFAKEVS